MTMKKESCRKQPRSILKVALALLPLLALTFSALALLPPSSSVAQGHWVLSDVQDCPDGLACTEWELVSGERKDVPCCQDPSMVGSTFYHSCSEEEGGYFRQ